MSMYVHIHKCCESTPMENIYKRKRKLACIEGNLMRFFWDSGGSSGEGISFFQIRLQWMIDCCNTFFNRTLSLLSFLSPIYHIMGRQFLMLVVFDQFVVFFYYYPLSLCTQLIKELITFFTLLLILKFH